MSRSSVRGQGHMGFCAFCLFAWYLRTVLSFQWVFTSITSIIILESSRQVLPILSNLSNHCAAAQPLFTSHYPSHTRHR